jgi:long-subunit fatty acid transport protein
MIRYFRFIVLFLLTAVALGANAQSTATTSSPYSRYGLGDINPMLMPQNVAMGGIGVATNRINGFNTVNPLNPASYSAVNLTVIDVGLFSNFSTLQKTGQSSQSSSNFRLNHIAFGIPVSKRSALAFGLMPYSELGYNYRQVLSSGFGTGLPSDTAAVNYLYNGDGGLTKLYLGYGFGIGNHLKIGANASYIFGSLKETQSTELPELVGTLNSRIEESNSIRGLNYDYGVQYSFDFSAKKHLTLGYSASANTKLKTQNSYIVSSYFRDGAGDEDVATDSIINIQSGNAKVQLPQINRFGISYQHDGKFLIGADYTIGQWSYLSIAGVNQGLQDSKTLNVGGQFTPNINSLSNYFASVDYRLGFIYDQTYINVNSTNIKKYAATFGVGLPLRPNNTSFYKINIAAELGKRGTLVNGLVKENYVNIHLAFTLNDRWFLKYKFD